MVAGLLALGILYTIYFARGLLLPIILALLFASLLQPLVSMLNRIRIPDAIGAIIVLLLLCSALGLLTYHIAGPASAWFQRRPYLAQQLDYKLRTLKQSLEEAKETTKELEKIAKLEDGDGDAKEPGKVVVEGPTLADELLTRTQSLATMLAITLVLVYFLLSRGRPTLKRLAGEMEEGGVGKMWAKIMVQVQKDVARYLFTVTLINGSLGVATGLAMWLLGMPSPVLWGVVATLLNFVPYLGGAVTIVIIAAVSLLSFDTWQQIVVPPLLFAGFTALEGQFLTPLIVGRRLSLNPIAVIVSLLFWGWVWGIGGMLIAVPILAAIKIVARNIPSMGTVRAVIG